MNRIIIIVLITIISIQQTFAQENKEPDKSQSLIELMEFKLLFELLNIKSSPAYITQVTKYPLTGLGAAGIRTDIEVHRIVYDGEIHYFMEFIQNMQWLSSSSACYISYEGISKVQESLEILKNELIPKDGEVIDFRSNYFSRGDDFRVGYYFVKEVPKWYIYVGDSGYKTTIEGTFWLESALKEAKEKIETLKKLDAK